VYARWDDEKLGQATLTAIHKVMVIFVGEDANNTSRHMSLVNFTVVIIAFDVWIILDLSCNTVAKVGQGQPNSRHCSGWQFI